MSLDILATLADDIEAAIASLTGGEHCHELDELTDVQKARKPKPYGLLRQAVETGADNIRRVFLTAITQVKNGTSIAAVRAAIERGDLDEAAELVPWHFLEGAKARAALIRSLRNVFDAGTEVGPQMIRGAKMSEFTLIDDPNWQKAIDAHGAARVVEIGADMRASVKAAITTMADNGLNAQQAATAVKNTQIGLFDRWSTAVENYRQQLTDDGRKPSEVARYTAQYHERLLNARTLMIARTEAQLMAASGKAASWDQAAEEGYFEPETAKKEWIASPNACKEICEPLDGKVVGLNEEFASGLKEEPAHPNCSCSTQIITD